MEKIIIDICPSKKLLLFDLDETLVHCFEGEPKKFTAKTRKCFLQTESQILKCDINVRPFVNQALRKLKEAGFELGIFTASSQDYADAIIEQIIDPFQELISVRLYRHHCFRTEDGIYIKDLRILDHPLNQTLLIDNSVHSFGFQIPNGIPIIPFFSDPNDLEMHHLANYLTQLVDLSPEELVDVNCQTFSLQSIDPDTYITPSCTSLGSDDEEVELICDSQVKVIP